jgi:hypothetical protein
MKQNVASKIYSLANLSPAKKLITLNTKAGLDLTTSGSPQEETMALHFSSDFPNYKFSNATFPNYKYLNATFPNYKYSNATFPNYKYLNATFPN